MKVVVSYSGGKDSQASLIWAVNQYGSSNVTAVFCDTGWENPITYIHIQETCKLLSVKVETLKSEKYNGMVDLAKQKGRFASTKARFCTSELKMIPMIDYVLAQKDNLLIVQGIRGDESVSRSKMKNQCTFFKYYFTPYNKKGRKFSYRKKEVEKFLTNYSDDIIRPMFSWSGHSVIGFILENGQKPNPLYYQGFKRVGCFPCFMSGHQEVKQILKLFPKRFDEIIEIENKLNSSFFKPDYVPERFRTGVCPRSGKKFSKAIDIRKYLEDKNQTLDLFETQYSSCSSFYHLCE